MSTALREFPSHLSDPHAATSIVRPLPPATTRWLCAVASSERTRSTICRAPF